jgi:hypothetical protein
MTGDPATSGTDKLHKEATRIPRQYEVLWPNCNVKHLVLSSERFIVFLDDVLDVDWSTSDAYDQDGHRDPRKHNAVVNEAALLEATPCEGVSLEIKTHFKRLIGEAIARSLGSDYIGANQMLRSAQLYILARSQELSRRWYLSASMVMALPFAFTGCVFWYTRTFFIKELGDVAFWLLLSSVGGAIGALLSVIQRTGRLTFDCSAGRALHCLEATSRIWAGAISGVLAGLAVRSEVILAVLARGERAPAIMMLAAFAAGAGERLATSIIADVTTRSGKPERPVEDTEKGRRLQNASGRRIDSRG